SVCVACCGASSGIERNNIASSSRSQAGVESFRKFASEPVKDHAPLDGLSGHFLFAFLGHFIALAAAIASGPVIIPNDASVGHWWAAIERPPASKALGRADGVASPERLIPGF